jgi:Phage integrase family
MIPDLSSGAREQEMTYAQAAVRNALEIGKAAVIPCDRAKGAGEMWLGRFRWDNEPGWKLRLKKSKTRSAIKFDLQNYSLLFPLLESVPLHERAGPIVKGEHGVPVRERSYRKWFRKIARAAGIPDEVWNMDSRAGGATKADEAGADLKAISGHLTHSETKTTVRYIHRVQKRTTAVAEARNRKRAEEGVGRSLCGIVD